MLPNDPRLKGFGDRATLAEVQGWIDSACAALPVVEMAADAAAGLVLAADMTAPADLPPVAASALDGLALRAEETYGASSYNPLMIQLVGRGGQLLPGTAMQVPLGAPLPEGADAVLGYEAAEIAGGMVEVMAHAAPGQGIVRPGQDAAAGQVLLPACRRLRGEDCALALTARLGTLPVHPGPRVLLLSAGRFAGADLLPVVLGPIIRRDGGRVVGQGAARGDREALARLLLKADADLIVIAGASGLDADDRAALVLAQVGELTCHGLALRPGDTGGFGRVADTPVLLLPGSPGALRLSWEMTGARAVRRLAGLPPGPALPTKVLPLAHKVVSEVGWDEILPARINHEGMLALTAREVVGSGAVARADGFILVPADGEGYAEGTPTAIHLFDT